MAGFSTKAPQRLGKPGRPRKDRILERLRIYRAAGPLVLRHGVRGTTMDSVAHAACLSTGGIYHYFRSKQQLVTYGLDPEGLSGACMEESRALREALGRSRRPHPMEVVELYVEKNVRMLDFVRPALHAAIELGRPELREALSAGLREDADSLAAVLDSLHASPSTSAEAANAIRRTLLGLALDESVRPAEARRQLLWLFRLLVPHLTARSAGRRETAPS